MHIVLPGGWFSSDSPSCWLPKSVSPGKKETTAEDTAMCCGQSDHRATFHEGQSARQVAMMLWVWMKTCKNQPVPWSRAKWLVNCKSMFIHVYIFPHSDVIRMVRPWSISRCVHNLHNLRVPKGESFHNKTPLWGVLSLHRLNRLNHWLCWFMKVQQLSTTICSFILYLGASEKHSQHHPWFHEFICPYPFAGYSQL